MKSKPKVHLTTRVSPEDRDRLLRDYGSITKAINALIKKEYENENREGEK